MGVNEPECNESTIDSMIHNDRKVKDILADFNEIY